MNVCASGVNVSDAATAEYDGVTPDRLMFCVVRRATCPVSWSLFDVLAGRDDFDSPLGSQHRRLPVPRNHAVTGTPGHPHGLRYAAERLVRLNRRLHAVRPRPGE